MAESLATTDDFAVWQARISWCLDHHALWETAGKEWGFVQNQHHIQVHLANCRFRFCLQGASSILKFCNWTKQKNECVLPASNIDRTPSHRGCLDEKLAADTGEPHKTKLKFRLVWQSFSSKPTGTIAAYGHFFVGNKTQPWSLWFVLLKIADNFQPQWLWMLWKRLMGKCLHLNNTTSSSTTGADWALGVGKSLLL